MRRPRPGEGIVFSFAFALAGIVAFRFFESRRRPPVG